MKAGRNTKDVSKSGRADKTTPDQLRLAEAVFNNSVGCLVILDRNFNFVRVNAAYAQACRKDIGEFAGRNHFDLYPTNAKAIFEEVVRTKRPFHTFARAFSFPEQPEREVTYWDWTLAPVLDERGEVEYLVFSLNDVSERVRADESAQLNENRLRLALRNINMAVFHQDRDLRYTWMYQPQLGYQPEQVIGQTDAELLPPDAARRVTELKKRVLQTGETVLAEVAVADKDPNRLYELLAEPMRDAAGTVVGLMGVTLDITDRKHVEESLRDSEEELRAIFDGALDGILVADAEDRTFVAANPAICRMLGYTRDELLGMSVVDIHSPQDLPRVLEEFDSLLRGETEMSTDVPLLRKDRSVSYADIKATRIRLGNRDCLLGMFGDVTRRKESDRQFVESEARFRGLVEQSIAGIYIIQDGKFAYVNPRFAEILGYVEPGELVGRDAPDLVAEKDRARIVAIRQSVEGETRSAAYTFTGLRKDGTEVEVGVHGTHAIHMGRPAVIGLLQDISEKKRDEEKIAHYVSKLEAALMGTVKVTMNLGELRDPYTAGHERRVAEIAVAIGAELGLDANRQEGLRIAGYLHDVGKIIIPSEILTKPGKLTAIEYMLVKAHPQAAFDVLKEAEFPWPIARVALEHHERLDGSGYPQGLKGGDILFESRIVAVADVIEAMSSHRPYRPGFGIDAALAEIERRRGTAYDADVADATLRLFREGRFQPAMAGSGL